MIIKRFTYTHAILLIFLLIGFLSCDKDTASVLPEGDYETVDILISDAFPTPLMRTPGDPGTSQPEEQADWNKIDIVIVAEQHLGDQPTVRRLSYTQEEYNQLPTYDDTNFRKIQITKMLPGKVYLYALTYTAEASGAEEIDKQLTAIQALKDWTKAKQQIEALTIPNSYAEQTKKGDKWESNKNHLRQMLSVATGAITPYEIKPGDGLLPGERFAKLTLNRLATKIDIQWDAVDAADIHEVRVKQVNIKPKATPTPTDAGSGRLFPTLVQKGAPALIGSKQFINTSPVSQRNGRVYHYVFPDGVTTPVIQFGLTGKMKDSSTKDYLYTITLTPQGEEKPLIPSAWYKVNVNIKGLSGNANITVSDKNATTATE